MPVDPLSLEIREHVGTLLLNRPPANAFDDAQLDRMERVLDEIRPRGDLRLVIVRGAGRHFCAGADIKAMVTALDADDMTSMNAFVARIQALFNEWAALEVPTLAVIEGAATGGGLELALACDLRIASASARLALPEVKLGLLPAGGGTQRLTQLVGRGTALRLMLTGEMLDGRTAHELGVVQWCSDDADVEATVDDVVARLLDASGPAQRLIKRCVGLTGTADGYPAEPAAQRILYAEPDTVDRLTRFVRERAKSRAASTAGGDR